MERMIYCRKIHSEPCVLREMKYFKEASVVRADSGRGTSRKGTPRRAGGRIRMFLEGDLDF